MYQPLSYRWLRHTIEKRDNARERYANFVLPIIEDPLEVYLTQYDDGTWRRRYIGLFHGDRQALVIVRVNNDGRLFWNFMQADDRRINKQRIGELA